MESLEWRYLVDLRQELMTAISGISNAVSYANWDNTTPNFTIRRNLQLILDRAKLTSCDFGIFIIKRHTNCGKRTHSKNSDTHGYVCSDVSGTRVSFLDNRFVWEGSQLGQRSRFEPCPCSKKLEPVEHYVIEDVVRNPETDILTYNIVSQVLSDLSSSIEHAGDKQPRAGIREYLLRAILTLNDAIMPVTVDAHIVAVTSRQYLPPQADSPIDTLPD